MAKHSNKVPKPERKVKAPDSTIHGRGKFEPEMDLIEPEPPGHKAAGIKCLILCEGETEAGYFMALEAHTALKYSCEIHPIRTGRSLVGYRCDTPGLILDAMSKIKTARVPYEAVWIITDNDEGEGYKLDGASLLRIEQARIPEDICRRLRGCQIVPMHVRVDADKHDRDQFFLHIDDYQAFLQNKILLTTDEQAQYQDAIISLTTRRDDFSRLYADPVSLFHEPDGTFKWLEKAHLYDAALIPQINIAFSSISFEHWLLLHFERNDHAFYNSREIIRYFDDRGHFGGNFQKGWYLYEQREAPAIKAFYHRVEQAIRNSCWLQAQMQPHLIAGKRHYEINPFTDVHVLAAQLLHTTFIQPGQVIDFFSYRAYTIRRAVNDIEVTFAWDKTPVRQEFVPAFSAIRLTGFSALNSINMISTSVQGGFHVRLTLEVSSNQPILVYLKVANKGTEHVLVVMV